VCLAYFMKALLKVSEVGNIKNKLRASVFLLHYE
jgi:hypothetical protein